VVLKIHVVREGGHDYYVHDLVPGRAEDSLVVGEEPGAWVGEGAGALGLSGRVGSPEFAELLAGRDPSSGRALRASSGTRSVAGFDLTFAAPKSVSLLHLLAPREIAEAAGAGHQQAVADALGYLGREGVGARRQHHGQVSYLGTTGPVAGQFLHRTSRALDPHLHTHVVVANVAEGVDGRWSSVDSRRLHSHLGAAQALYHVRLRGELGERMGAAWSLRPSGVGDVVGVDPGLCRLFSTRTASMDEYRQQRGLSRSGSASSTAAFHADRPDKDRDVTVDHLMSEWRTRAADLGIDLGDLTRSVGAHRRQDDLVVDRDRFSRRLLGLTLESRPVGRCHLVAALAASMKGGASVHQVEGAVTVLIEACGVPTRSVGEADGLRGDFDGRWDPAHVVRVMDGLAVDHHGREVSRASPSGSFARGSISARDLVPDQATASVPALTIEGTAVRRLKTDAPLARSRSLGMER
jgi:conjugative relaxase-like TrwC/TraI family protein